MKKLIIIGTGETAILAYEYFTHDSSFDVVAFSIEKQFIKDNELLGLPIVSFERLEELYPPQDHFVFIAVSYTQLNRVRAKLYLTAKQKGYRLASYVSSHAFIWHNVKIGENCFILENNVLQPFVEIGDNVFLWSGNHVGHRSTIADNCFISSHVVISGFCNIGKNCFVGVNATFADHVSIGDDCVIGAGTLINKNLDENSITRGITSDPKPKARLLFKVKE